MKNSTLPPNSPTADYRLYLYTQLATGICLMILSPVTVISNALLLFTIFKDPLKCFRTPATYFMVALAFVDLKTGLLVAPFFSVPCGNVRKMVPHTGWALPHLVPNWNMAVLRGFQRIVSACSWSYFDAVHRHNIPASLSLSCDNTQSPRLCWLLFRVLHWIHSPAVCRCTQSNFISGRPPSSLHTDNRFTYPQFRHAFEVVSSICQRITPAWWHEQRREPRRWWTLKQTSNEQNKPATVYDCNPAIIGNSHRLRSSSYHNSSYQLIHEAKNPSREAWLVCCDHYRGRDDVRESGIGCVYLRLETDKIPEIFKNSACMPWESSRTRCHWSKDNG